MSKDKFLELERLSKSLESLMKAYEVGSRGGSPEMAHAISGCAGRTLVLLQRELQHKMNLIALEDHKAGIRGR